LREKRYNLIKKAERSMSFTTGVIHVIAKIRCHF